MSPTSRRGNGSKYLAGSVIVILVTIVVTSFLTRNGRTPLRSALSGCSQNGTVAPCQGAQLSGASGWLVPVLDQEFNGTSLNTHIWSPVWFAAGNTPNGVEMSPSNVTVAGGDLNLVLTGSSGGIVSSNPADGRPSHAGFQFAYGYAEARIYLPPAGPEVANWPAWWTDSQNWPISGEMDVVEGLGGDACWHFHYGTSVADEHGPGGCSNLDYSGWHIYGAEWEKGEVTYYYDGIQVGQLSKDITGAPMYLVLENSEGAQGGPAVSPATMRVDYVRVWK